MPTAWKTEAVRLSLFSNGVIKLLDDDLTAFLGDREPELDQKAAGKRTITDKFLDGQLVISAAGERVDFTLGPPPLTERPTADYVPSAGEWPVTQESFAERVEQLLADWDKPVTRIAVGAVLLSPKTSSTEANKHLFELIPQFNGVPERIRDFNLRVNIPSKSRELDGLQINRLIGLSAIELKFQFLRAPGHIVVEQEDLSLWFSRLEMDHSTEADRIEPFAKGQLQPIYKELTALVLENADKGLVI